MAIFQLGSAVADLHEDTTAYSHRNTAHDVNINGVWLPTSPWPLNRPLGPGGSFAALEPHQTGAYVNDQNRVHAAYGDEKYRCLAALKHRYHPDNVFRLNHNTEPAGSGRSPPAGESPLTAGLV
jgi:hypothetical protein